MASGSFRSITAVIVVAFAALFLYSFTQAKDVRSPDDATKIVFDDLESDPLVSLHKHAYSLFSAEKDVAGQWQVIVKVTIDPHTACPKAFIRTYQLLPIRHGLDKTVTADCKRGTPVAFPDRKSVV